MAHQNPIVPIRNKRSEPISWPNPEEPMPQALPAQTSATVNDIYRSSLSAAERSIRATQRKISGTATALNRSIRRFADDRPLHFVGVVAGVALIAGVALRIWRSKRDA
jgi:hypothetical protein